MQTVARSNFTTVKTEGAILPPDLLQRIADGKMEGLKPADYHLSPDERLNEAINRAWNRCLGVWQSFNEQRQKLPVADRGTSLTRERWLLILFQELGYGRLSFQRQLKLEDGATYPISHRWGQHTPIHLVSFRQELERRDPAIKRSPHSLMQEFLNRSDDHLWGFISNGLSLQILRDNISLTRAAYLEFDLEKMMTEQLYADFTLLWLVCHQSRVEVGVDPNDRERSSAPALPGNCWLEKWSQTAAEQGTRALDALRGGVQEAIAALGRGFLAHRANSRLKEKLRSGALSKEDYFRQLLRLVYRLIFLFVAEDRDLLLPRETDEQARSRYTTYYSAGRLRRLANARRGGPHPDLYRTLRRIFSLLRAGYPALGLPALGSFLFSDRSTPALDELDIANLDLLNAIRALAFTIESGVHRPVDYKNLGAEELGSVYESLLELHPFLNIEAAAFTLELAAGSERKTTGSYYTPASLITSLLDSALEPVVADRLRHKQDAEEAEQAILNIKVVDPACGSGHFLIAAAHRLAARLARVRTGDDEPSPTARREALRDVVHHCIHGVDINEMAVELCKVGLWLETLDPGKPLGFLDRNIQCGNSLMGATPALLQQGVPNAAFKPITGDDKAYCTEFRKRNREQHKGMRRLLKGQNLEPWNRLGNLEESMRDWEMIGNDSLDDVRTQEEKFAHFRQSQDYLFGKLWADAWCAAFVWPKRGEANGGYAYPLTEEEFRNIERTPYSVPVWMREEIKRLSKRYQFFHWHIAFPLVFPLPPAGEGAENEQMGWHGGFDVVLGNPPWERIKLQEKEWFASRDEAIAAARNAAARRRLIAQLPQSNPALYADFMAAKRAAEGASHFVRNSGRYPLCGRGDVNTYTIFAELARQALSGTGRAGIIVPSGIATDDTTKYFFQDLMETGTLVSLYDFENRMKIFPAVDSRMKFCLLTLTGADRPAAEGAQFVFFALETADLRDAERRFTLSAADIALLNPNTRTCPIFRSRRDTELTKAIYRRVPVLIKEGTPEVNPWGIRFFTMFHMSNDSGLFRTREQLAGEGWQL
ncbi:MAG: Eco57I restriction-modification methylase domain-containing protein, partial [Anaerolineae bacterium]